MFKKFTTLFLLTLATLLFSLPRCYALVNFSGNINVDLSGRPSATTDNQYNILLPQGGYQWQYGTWFSCLASENQFGESCRSSTIPEICPQSNNHNFEEITIKLTNDTTQETHPLTLIFSKYFPMENNISFYLKRTSLAAFCDLTIAENHKHQYSRTHLDIKIKKGEMQKLWRLGSNGIWRGKLTLQQFDGTDNNHSKVQSGTATINVNIKVTNSPPAPKIYFLNYPSGSPKIKMNLNTKPGFKGNSLVTGRAGLDLCLYDAFNEDNKATRAKISFYDNNGLSNKFILSRKESSDKGVDDRGGSDLSSMNRILYRVFMTHPATGAKIEFSPDIYYTFTGIKVEHLRKQTIPGIKGIVSCVPSRLELEVVPFRHASRASGDYQSQLVMSYEPET